MLQYSTYSVISPEGCAYLWKTDDRASDAAEAMGITAQRLKQLGLVDEWLSPWVVRIAIRVRCLIA